MPDALTRREDVYPRGDNIYALANPHNFQAMLNPDNSSRPWSSTRQPCLSQSNKGLLLILLPKNISNGYERPPCPLRTHGHSPRMGNFSYSRGPSTSLIMQTSDLTFSDPTMIIALPVTPGLERLSAIFVVSFTGPDSYGSSPTMYTHAQLVAATNRSTTNRSAPTGSSQSPPNLGILFLWTSLKASRCQITTTQSWSSSAISRKWHYSFPLSVTLMLKT